MEVPRMRKWVGYLALICTVMALAFGATTLAAVAAPHSSHARAAARRADARKDSSLKHKATSDARKDAAATRMQC